MPEETITFDAPEAEGEAETTTANEPSTEQSPKPAPKHTESDYEIVNDDTANEEIEADSDSPLDDADYELDELEAEIARELEDD